MIDQYNLKDLFSLNPNQQIRDEVSHSFIQGAHNVVIQYNWLNYYFEQSLLSILLKEKYVKS